MTHAKDRITSLVILAVAVIGWMETADIPDEPRLFPRALLVILGTLGLVMLARTFLTRAKAEDDMPFATNWRSLLTIAAMSLALIWLVSTIGFFSGAIPFLVAFTLVAGYRRYLNIALTAVIFLGSIYVVFVWLFDRPLPRELFLSLLA